MTNTEIKANRPRISIKIDRITHDEFDAACRLESTTMSDVLRASIKKYIEEKRNKLMDLRSKFRD